MAQIQFQLSEEHLRKLRRMARREGISLAEMIRRCVVRFLETTEKPARSELYVRAAGLVGAFKDREGATDLSVHHDRYLDQAFR